jgi:flagellar protein FlaG
MERNIYVSLLIFCVLLILITGCTNNADSSVNTVSPNSSTPNTTPSIITELPVTMTVSQTESSISITSLPTLSSTTSITLGTTVTISPTSLVTNNHASDQQIRTNMQIVLDVANQSQYVRVWIKNTGSVRIPANDIENADVFCGDAGNFNRMNLLTTSTLSNGQWSYTLINPSTPNSWNPGDILEVDAYTTTINSVDPVYFQFVLPSGVSTSDQFTVGTTP